MKIVAKIFRECIQHVSMPSVGSRQSEGHIIMGEGFFVRFFIGVLGCLVNTILGSCGIHAAAAHKGVNGNRDPAFPSCVRAAIGGMIVMSAIG